MYTRMNIGSFLGAFVSWPFLALLPAIFFAALYFSRRRPIILAVALAWLVYCFYELAMKLRILCSGECNIRIDLLFLYPFLALLSVVGLVAYIQAFRAAR